MTCADFNTNTTLNGERVVGWGEGGATGFDVV